MGGPVTVALGRVMSPSGSAFDGNGNALFSGKLTYARPTPEEPLQAHVIRSSSSLGQFTSYDGGGLTLMTGPVATMNVSWQAPLKLGN